MDKDFKKVFEKAITNAFKIAVGNRGARGGGVNNQFILNNFKRRWDSERQKTYEQLTPETEDKKTTDYFLVESEKLREAVRNTIRVRMSGSKITAEVTVPDYGKYIQEGTLNMPARPFFTLKGIEKEFYGLIESQLTLEFNRLGIKSKENK